VLTARRLGLVAVAAICACWLLAPAGALAAGAPAVTGVAPASGPMTGGTSVTISGSGFSGATAVMFGTQASPSYTVNSDGSITATAPQDVAALYNAAANAGKGALSYSAAVDLTVTTAAGTSATSSADQFLYNWALTVVNGSQRKVYGLADLEGMTIYDGYGGFLKGDPPYVTHPYTGAKLLDLLADTGGLAAKASVQFGTADNYGMLPYTFADVTDPFDNFGAYNPLTGNPLATDPGLTVVFVYGTGSPWALLPTSIGPQIALLSLAATQVTMGFDWPHFLTSITTPTAVPNVSAVSPTGSLEAGGTPVTIAGANLGAATAVGFGSVAAAGFVVNSATQITAVAPAQAAGTVDVTVTTPGGTSATGAGDKYTYADGTPAVTSVSPASGTTLGATSVTITGAGFSGANAVDFGTVSATSYKLESATQITAVAPAQAAGTVDVTVGTPVGQSATSAADQYTYVAPDLADATIAPIPNQPYSGSAITPALTVTCDGALLARGADYTVAYSNNTAMGKAAATLTGVGPCRGSASVGFVIVPAKVALLRVSVGHRQAVVTWKRSGGGVSGYRVTYRAKGGSTWGNAALTKALTKVVRKLARGKSYAFRVCAWKVIGGTRYYGVWSRTMTVKVRK
jgi:hypothetical protein